MNNAKNKVLKAISKLALYSAKRVANSATVLNYHQPKEPVDLKAKLAAIKADKKADKKAD